jgi:hypothetical protein
VTQLHKSSSAPRLSAAPNICHLAFLHRLT